MSNTLVIDNGAYQIKGGYISDLEPRHFYNAIVKSKNERKRVFIADELEECQDRYSLYFVLPFEKGYLVNWDAQLQIWNRVFGKEVYNVDYQDCRLVLTDPSDIARAFVDDNINEIVFENYQFNSLLKTSAPSLVARANFSAPTDCSIVVDSGHSFTHIVPYVQGKIASEGVIRIDVGGKALTNQLKDWISYRQINVYQETYLINNCKEDVCFVSQDINEDIAQLRSNRVDYFLPDFVSTYCGEVQHHGQTCQTSDRQKLTLAVERIAIPEILFHPADVGINQMGVVEALHTSLSQFPKDMQYGMAKNVILVGGSSQFSGYKKRVDTELKTVLDDFLDFNTSSYPVTYPWHCAKRILSTDTADHEFCARFVSRSEYAENGPNICRKRFRNVVNQNLYLQ